MKEIRVTDKNKPLIPFVYQAKLIKKAIETVNKSKKHSVFVVSPPGSGKTLIMATIAKLFTDKGKRVMFMVHRQEIVDQATETFKRQGVDMSLVRLGMVQTLRNREEEVKDFDPQVMFVDEAHHTIANSYLRVLGWVPNAYKFYFTATPWRGDGQGFEILADNDDLILGPSVDWLIKHKYLSDFDYYVKTLYDTLQLKIGRNGDYDNNSVVEQANNIDVDQIINTYIEKGNNEPAIVYAGSIEQSQKIVDEFNQRGISAAHLDGGTDKNDRSQKLQDFKDGKIKIISNVQIFTEGVDLPDASVALIARPTKSVAFYYQFAMRVLRYKEGKRAKIIDFAGIANELGLPNAERKWSLLSRDLKQDEDTIKEPVIYECPECLKAWSKDDVVKSTVFKDKQIIITISCPEDGSTIKTIRRNQTDPDVAQLAEIVDKKEFEEEWYRHAKISRDQDLKMNARILKTQRPEIKTNDLFVELLKVYIPNYSSQNSFEKIKAVNEPPESEIDDMIDYLDEGERQKELFKTMFKRRKQAVVNVFLSKTDLMKINSNDELKELFKEKVRSIRFENQIYGEKTTSQDIVNRIAKESAQSVFKDKMLVEKAQFSAIKEFSIRLRALNLVSGRDAERLYDKAIQELDKITTDQYQKRILGNKIKHQRKKRYQY